MVRAVLLPGCHCPDQATKRYSGKRVAAGASLSDNWTVRSALALLAVAAAVVAAPTATAKVIVSGYPLAGRCPAAGVRDDVDPWMMNSCNCTSYVAWALEANDQRTDWFVPGSMDAWNWPNVARRAGLPVGTAPRVGAVAVWSKLSKPFGHVAYVTAVHRDGTLRRERVQPGAEVRLPAVHLRRPPRRGRRWRGVHRRAAAMSFRIAAMCLPAAYGSRSRPSGVER